MRILVVMTKYPFPPLAGSLIVGYNSMKYLSKHHVIDFISFQPRGLVHPAEFVEQVELVFQKKVSRFTMWIRYLSYMLAGIPSSVSAFASRQMKEKVKYAIERGKYDVFLLFEMGAIQYFPPHYYNKLIVNIEDPQSIKLSRMRRLLVCSLWQRTRLFVLARLTASYEDKLLPRMAKVLLLSASDLNDMRELGGYDNLSYMPYGVELRESAEITGFENRERAIIFSGNMFHPPNVDGALLFLRDIFPLILEQYPSAILWIVGADPDNRIYEAATKFGTQVLITGKVDDLADYIKRASVSVCPVRLKIGVQTKILEALSWGTPVVTTSAGNSGVAGVSGTHLWVEDDPQMLAKRVVELLQGLGWSKLSIEGRRLVAERFSWEGSVRQLEQYLESMATN